MKILSSAIVVLFHAVSTASAGVEHRFDTPSDDAWHYPFNFTPGFRPLGGVFSPGGVDDFNDRDGILILAWDTTELIAPGQALSAYDIQGLSVTVTNFAASFLVPEWTPDLTVDEWYTYYTGNQADTDPGRPIELFGVGFGPAYDVDTWTEGDNFVGATQNENRPRDPFPMTFDEVTGQELHLEDNLRGTQNESLVPPLCDSPDDSCPFTPIPWAIGHPQDYTPGSQQVPFDIRFDIDLDAADELVRAYFQEGLQRGRVIVSISSLLVTVQQGSSVGYPNVFMKEGVSFDPLGKAASLTVTLASEVTGDVEPDGLVSLSDWAFMSDCLMGPDTQPSTDGALTSAECRCFFDFDSDGDIDAMDVAAFAQLQDEG
ncbi:MAG: hypothetical protein ACPGXK_06390 [Phycisphaerae bacterium]